MNRKNITFGVLLSLLFSLSAIAQEINLVLKNGKVIVGNIIEEKPDYILIENEIGQVKVNRQNIESITYNPFLKLGENKDENIELNDANSSQVYKFSLKDPVVVYLRNGTVVAGLLLAKSLNMVMLQTESGNLTIPKRDLSRIEYVSSEYAERGEVVIAYLNNGQRFEGNIYFETSNDLTLDTEIGRLTLPKKKLRTIEYTGEVGMSRMTIADQYTNITVNKRMILPRYDVIGIGYSSSFGSNFGSGFGLNYKSRYSIAELEGLNLSAVGGLSLNYFTLNSDNIANENQNLSANVKGGAFITTLSGGGQINIYPQTGSFYDFYLAPALEGHLIYSTLEETYTSFPQLNSKNNRTEFKLGLGLQFGTEFLFDSFRIGVNYNMHLIFGADGFNQFSLTFVKPIL